MSSPVFADPRTDAVFKRIFGAEERRHVLVAFLNDMLELDEPDRIVGVELLPPDERPAVKDLEISFLDVRCTDAHGVKTLVQVQVLRVERAEERAIYHVARAYASQLKRGVLLRAFEDIVGVSVCAFELWPDSAERRIPMLSRWQMQEEHSGARRLSQVQHVFLELPKHDVGRPPRTAVEKWASFFRDAAGWTAVPEALSEPPFLDALEAARAELRVAAE
jgi:predicted transposase/invertase (TIGR01784 family)